MMTEQKNHALIYVSNEYEDLVTNAYNEALRISFETLNLSKDLAVDEYERESLKVIEIIFNDILRHNKDIKPFDCKED